MTNCNYCHDKATHHTYDIDQEIVPSCAECCGGCIGIGDCDYQEVG